MGDDLVTCCPWWDGPRDAAALDDYLARTMELPRRRWIWVPRPARRLAARPGRPPGVG